MPAHCSAHFHNSPFAGATDAAERSEDVPQRVYLSPGDGEAIETIHHELMAREPSPEYRPQYAEPHSSFDKFLVDEVHAGKKKANMGVSFRSLTTWGKTETQAHVKTFATAVWRTLTLQDVYEWTLKPWITDNEPQNGRPLIRDMSGVVRSGEMML